MDTDEPHDDLLPLLLRICEDFITGADPAVHNEVDELAVLEGGAVGDEGDEVRRIDGEPAGLGGLYELERHGQGRRFSRPVSW